MTLFREGCGVVTACVVVTTAAVLFASVSAWNLTHTLQVSVPAIWIQIQAQACYSHVTLLSPWHLKMADQWDASPRSWYSSAHKNNPRQTTTRLKTHMHAQKSPGATCANKGHFRFRPVTMSTVWKMNDSYYSSLIWIYGHDTTSVQLSEQSSNTNTAPHKSQNEWPQFKAYKTITQSNTSDLDSLNRSLAYKAKNTQQQLDWRTRGKTKTSDH